MPSISVAMATYNGAKFLREQLHSIATQTVLPDELVICDDCSTDDTVLLLEEFARSAPFPVRIVQNGENLGFANNFLKCASICRGDWTTFCDQDDIWLPHKLACMAEEIERSGDDVVLLYHAASLVNEALEPTGTLLPHIPSRRVHPSGDRSAFWFVGGCVMCFRSCLLEGMDSAARPMDSYRGNKGWENGGVAWMPHDKWVCLLANMCGTTVAIPDVLSLYRRHATTATGSHLDQGIAQRIAQARATGTADYEFMAARSRDASKSLRGLGLSSLDDPRAGGLATGASKFATISEHFTARARIHSTGRGSTKLREVAGLVRRRAYSGDPFTSFGYRALAKDLVAAMGLFKNKRHNQ